MPKTRDCSETTANEAWLSLYTGDLRRREPHDFAGLQLFCRQRADGMRACKTTNAGKVSYVYDVFGHPVLETVNNQITAINSFGANGLTSRRSGGSSTFYTFDAFGNTSQRLDSNGAVLSTHACDEYGMVQSTPSEPNDPFYGYGAQFGNYLDTSTGLYLMGHRYYDAYYARFVNADPIGLGGGVNEYGYVRGNPLVWADPSGLQSYANAGPLSRKQLYALFDPEGNLLKWGKSVNAYRRYTNIQLEAMGGTSGKAWIRVLMEGDNPSITDTETTLVKNFPGPLNREQFAAVGGGKVDLATLPENMQDVMRQAQSKLGAQFPNETGFWQTVGQDIENCGAELEEAAKAVGEPLEEALQAYEQSGAPPLIG